MLEHLRAPALILLVFLFVGTHLLGCDAIAPSIQGEDTSATSLPFVTTLPPSASSVGGGRLLASPNTTQAQTNVPCVRGPEGACLTAAGLRCLMSKACRADGLCLANEDGSACVSAPHFKPTQCAFGWCEYVEAERRWKPSSPDAGRAIGFNCDRDTPDMLEACAARDWASCALGALSDGECPTFGQVYCREQEGCKTRGRCTHFTKKYPSGLNQGCKIAGDDDCRGSDACSGEGKCAFSSYGGCIPKSAEHCANSLACKEQGRCLYKDRKCVATPEACAASTGCKEEGRCLFATFDGYKRVCLRPPEVPYDDVCLESCLDAGECTHKSYCRVENSAQCAQSAACRERGACAAVTRKAGPKATYLSCLATTKNHCEQSAGCKERGLCKLAGGYCQLDARGCRMSELCTKQGKCHFDKSSGQCVARSSADCEASLGCKDDGICKLDPAGRLCTSLPRSPDVFCAMSAACSEQGRCVSDEEGSACVAVDLAYCEAAFDVCKQRFSDGAPVCKIENGACALEPSFCRSPVYCKGPGAVCKPYELTSKRQTSLCEVVSFDCTETEECKRSGRCLAEGDACLVNEDACKISPRCKSDGLCEFDSSTYECKGHRDAYCREQSACKEEGRCSSVVDYDTDETSCGAKLDRDCEASSLCKDDGKCKAWRGSCVSEDAIAESDGDCADGQVRIDGGCRYPTGTSCKKTEFCKERGQCKASKPMRVCSDDGVCSKRKYIQCEVPAGSSCVGASACTNAYYDRWASHMTCDSFETRCEKPGDCVVSRSGWGSVSHCSFPELSMGSCQPASVCVLADRWCQRQPPCKERGECELVSNGTKGGDWLECRATEESHCAKSDACRERGDCALTLVSVLYDCGPTKQEHCQKSALCKEENRCTFDGAGCSF